MRFNKFVREYIEKDIEIQRDHNKTLRNILKHLQHDKADKETVNTCEPVETLMMSNPPKYKCRHCGRYWVTTDGAPECKDSRATSSDEFHSDNTEVVEKAFDLGKEVSKIDAESHGVALDGRMFVEQIEEFGKAMYGKDLGLTEKDRKKLENVPFTVTGDRELFTTGIFAEAKRQVSGYTANKAKFLALLEWIEEQLESGVKFKVGSLAEPEDDFYGETL